MNLPLAILLALWVALLAGCQRGARGEPAPWFRADLPHLGEFDLGGAASQPATVDITQGDTTVTVPAATPVTVAPDGTVSFTAAAPLSITTRGLALSATGPRAYPPPAAPTPSDDADATARLWAWIAAGLGVVGFALGLLKGWPLVRAGGACLAAAAIAIISLQAVPPWIWAIVGLGAVLAVTGPLLWRFVIRAQVEKANPPPPPHSAPAHA